MADHPLVIAVDGPAASGKGTIAKGLARHFGLPHLDTGKLYRAAALALLRHDGDPDSEFSAIRAAQDIAGLLDDPELKSETVGGIASRISAYPAVRAVLLERQRDFAAQESGAVLDGRDIGTVIAPHATAKLFVTASSEERARRRHAELVANGLPVHLADVLIDIRARDERDSHRSAAPLVQAEDALLLDTTALGPDDALAEAIRLVEGCLRS
ncbi:(d)CMP kinase [Sphingomonas rosea]|uniref:Cytidylate kinase n=1 Tax=Sphingomonas rosea TaxID=335605 RepID=A0ABP7U3P5_9SPHN